MDLFDLSNFFGSYVPIHARSHPLLKHAACACAAKHLANMQNTGAKAGKMGGKQPRTESFHDRQMDWEWESSHHFDKTIALFRDEMQNHQSDPYQLSGISTSSRGEVSGYRYFRNQDRGHQNRRPRSQLLSDEVVIAIAILQMYQSLSATATACPYRLIEGGPRLDNSEGNTIPLNAILLDYFLSPYQQNLLMARKATFWFMARQEYIAACECSSFIIVYAWKLMNTVVQKRSTRLDTENMELWREVGLLLDDDGCMPSTNPADDGLSQHERMKEDMISNTLVWLSSRLCNIIAAIENTESDTSKDRSKSTRQGDSTPNRQADQDPLKQWEQLQQQLDQWSKGLPPTFQPSIRINSEIKKPFTDVQILPPTKKEYPFDKIWYSIPMCGATMTHYHMARILMLTHKPHETTWSQGSVGERLKSFRELEEEIVHHCYEIW